jgi:hypothetical protein
MLKYYHPADVNVFKFNDLFEIKNILQRDPNYLDSLVQIAQGNVYTIWDDTPLAIAGWVPSLYDNASLFMFASANLSQKFNKEILKDFIAIADMTKSLYKRVDCIIAENKTNKRFIEFLGFKQEAILKNYNFDGADMYLYAFIKTNS